ncbi:hypothetical protein D3C85_681640 [compost metagenome]
MSNLMTEAILGMPFDMAMESKLSRMQFYARAQGLLKAVQEHNQMCDNACGGSLCYKNEHTNRECVDCPKQWKIEY